MKRHSHSLARHFAGSATAALLLMHGAPFAQTTDISNTPLSSSSSASVLPNLMFVLDDSGSMGRDYLPDFVNDNNTCKAESGWSGTTRCRVGDPPYYSAQFNTIFYNPQITYAPAINYDGTSMGSYGSPWTNVKNDAFSSSSGNTNLVTGFTERRYCNASGTICKRNGIDTVATFEYRSASPDDGRLYGYPSPAGNQTLGTVSVSKGGGTRTVTVTLPGHGLVNGDQINTNGTCTGGSQPAHLEVDDPDEPVYGVTANTFQYDGNSNNAAGPSNCTYSKVVPAFNVGSNIGTNPHYYTITPKEYCNSADLTNCVASTTPTATHTFPAYVRYCKTTADADAVAPVSGNSAGTPRCRAKYDAQSATTYTYPRYGNFTRTNIVPSTAIYGNRPNRVDCASRPDCTYAEEMTNFANWWAYYRTRMQMMKSAAGRAFLPIDNRYRVGFLTINPGNPVSSSEYLKIDKFDPSHKQAWYTKFYQQGSGGGTPLREALSRVGRHYAGRTDDINSGMSEDPVQYSCQQNFTILTTDGYWNGNSGDNIAGTAIGNEDNVNSGWSTRSAGAFDGNLTGASGTLADVALYYYKTDLRGAAGTKTTGALGTNVTQNNVPTSPKDSAPHQHMTTFTLGIVDGLMTYQSDYESATTGDFARIKAGAAGCAWTSGTCNWPVPVQDAQSALDDLWHAAVNGRGTYYQASDPNSVASGLSGALTGLNIRTAAAAASATSSPNITPTDRSIFSSTYTTVEWAGEVVAQDIDPVSGNVVPAIKWAAQALLDAKVGAATDTRTIHMFDAAASNKLKPFLFPGTMSATEQGYFANKCVPASNLSQCASLSAAQLAIANSGKNLVNFLRGQTQHETIVYRDRTHALGDTVNATPAYMREPRFAFADAVTPDYAAFKSANASRQATLFIAANDGMLHALNADNGQEMWAYVPKPVMPNLYKLADVNYASKHVYFVDGSPQLMDVFDGSAWKTILVGGFNSGARGYYALDVTDPLNPKALWEFCHDSTICAISDTDMGLSYSNPVITKRPSDSKWVVLVTSGYNNVSPGTGRGYLFVLDALTGAVLEKVDTGAGNTTTPSGLGRIAVWADSANVNNTGRFVYAGDLRGNLWRFDLTVSPTAVLKIAELKDSSGRPQSITTKPELGLVKGNRTVFVGTGRYLGTSDLQDPATWVPASTDAWQQSIYAIKDKSVAYGNIRAGGTLIQQTISVVSPTLRSTSTNPVDWTAYDGWYADFNPANDSPGERVSIDPQLLLGTLLVATNVPNADACTIGGDSWQYQFSYETGQYLSTSPNQAVAEKLSNAITVGIVVVRLPAGQLKAIATDAGGTKTTFGVNIGGSSASGKRTGWRELIR